MKSPRPIGALSLLGVLLAFGSAKADPVLSDQYIIMDALGNTVLNQTVNAANPGPRVRSGPLTVPRSGLNINFGIVLTAPGNPGVISDWVKVQVVRNPTTHTDKLFIAFQSAPQGGSLTLPPHFPSHFVTMSETGSLQNVTAALFPKYTAAGVPPPFTVEILSVAGSPIPVVAGAPGVAAPEPASLTLFGLGLFGLGTSAWRKRKSARAVRR